MWRASHTLAPEEENPHVQEVQQAVFREGMRIPVSTMGHSSKEEKLQCTFTGEMGIRAPYTSETAKVLH